MTASAALVRRVQRLGLPRMPAVLLAVMLAFTGIAVFGVIVGGQVVRLAENLRLELVSNCIVEPRLYGSSTGISTVAILVAAIFWTTLWGPIGLLLSTPLTVCLAVLGRHVPQLRFLDVMLGGEPVLSPPERLYQRMLGAMLTKARRRLREF